MVDRESSLMWVTVAGVVLAAALVFGLCLSDTLPIGHDVALAAERIFGSGHGVPPVWGALLRLAWTFLPGDPAFRLGIVSALAGVVGAGAITFTVTRAFALVAFPDRCENRFVGPFLLLVGPIAAFLFVSAPAAFVAATHVGPYAVQLALMALAIAFAYASPLDLGEEPSPTRVGAVMTGFVAALAAIEGLPGIIALPFVAARGGFDALARRGQKPSSYVGFFALGLGLAVGAAFALGWTIPATLPELRPSIGWIIGLGVIVVILFGSVRLRGVTVDTFLFFTFMLAVVGAQTWFCAHNYGTGRAADTYVRELVARLDGRRWLVSDGTFDALLRFRLPEGVHLVTYGRAGDRTHGEEIGRWVNEEVPNADDDLLLVADLGPSRFVEVWLSRPEAVTNCVFATAFEPPCDARTSHRVAPLGYCWRVEGADINADHAETAWRAAWAQMEPLLGWEEPAADVIRRRFAVHGNAIGTLLQEAGLRDRAWAVYAFARKKMDGRNLSFLLNMNEMARSGHSGNGLEAIVVAKRVKTELSGVTDLHALRRRLAEDGRLYVPEDVRQRLTEDVRLRRQAFWETPSGRQLRAGLDRLKAAEQLKGAVRTKELDAIAKAVAPVLGERMVAQWVKDLLLGQLALLRGGGYLEEARRHFRAVVERGEGDFHLTFDRLLAADMASSDINTLENDALRVLRREPRHALASALVGSARLVRGENASALRFLRNAERLGLASPAVLNDLALALARVGRRDEARETIRRARRAAPENAHLRATEAEIGKN